MNRSVTPLDLALPVPKTHALTTATRALGMLAVMTVLTGVLYPLFVTAVAGVALRERANGSLLVVDGTVRGSSLIGQRFEDPRWFWGRLSATEPPYNAAASTGSNLGPTNPAIAGAARARIAALRAADPGNDALVPVDLVTSSASGLDPHISPSAAEYQVRRVARVRGLDEDRVRTLVREHTEAPTLWILGEPRVDILELNVALDRLR